MLVTVTVLIGNSDNKLTQVEWADYCRDLDVFARLYARPVHFWGASQPMSEYQNACSVFEMETSDIDILREDLKFLAKKYHQNSVAIIVGMTDFIS